MKAFPYNHHEGMELGMDLRDYFAASALIGLISSPRPPAEKTENGYTTEIYARFSYDMADAMMEARKK
jgi:hypothetical protein